MSRGWMMRSEPSAKLHGGKRSEATMELKPEGTTYFVDNHEVVNLIWERLMESCEQLQHNGSFSATSISSTAKYLEGFASAKTFKDAAAGMGNAQVARVVSWWEEERSDDGTTLHEMVLFVWFIIAL